MGRTQKEVAALLSVNEWTYLLWEGDRNEPMIRMWPKVIGFLGYDPNGEPRTDGEALIALRRRFGLSRKRLAKFVGCDETTVMKLEAG